MLSSVQQLYEFAIASQAVTHLFTLILYVAFLGVENFVPGEKNHGINGKWRNAKIGSIRFVFGTLALYVIMPWLPSYPNSIFSDFQFGTFLYVLTFLFLFDLLFYLYHRAEHALKWLWPLHELHHSDAELNVTSSFRTHWLETPVQLVFVVLPCYYLLGVDVLGYAICTLIIVAQLLLTHSNLKLGYGWFTRFLCSPQMHRIHHSILPEHRGKNLCQMFPVFDIVFNTYHHPKKEEYPPTGLDSLASDASIGYVMKKPINDWLDQIEKK